MRKIVRCIGYGAELSLNNPHQYECSWNGPIWPFAVSIILNALGDVAKKYSDYKVKWCELFKKYTELHFRNGNRSLMCILEHYRPGDGLTFSDSTDYFHSEWINLFMKYWAGVEIVNSKVTFHPFTDEEFEIKNVLINNAVYNFCQYKDNGDVKQKIYKTS